MPAEVPEVAVQAVNVGVLAIAAAVVAIAVGYREALRRALLTVEDPRALGAVRIVFAAGLLLGVVELVQDGRWFFSDEGMFVAEGARAFFAGTSAAGYDGGWVSAPALWHYLSAGAASTLHFWDSPAVVTGHAVILVAAAVGLLIGWRTRVCAWVCMALLLIILRRNNTMWGGEQVLLAGLFLVAVGRSGHAYSVDNWLRCRRLRRRGLLSEPGRPGDGAGVGPGPGRPQGLAAVYRAVPAWPRVLMILQLGVSYAANGLTKWGAPWVEGTATAFALQSDAYVRFDTLPLLALVGEAGLRWATWLARGWESLFPLVVVGLAIGWWRRTGMVAPRGAWLLWGLLMVAVVAPLGAYGGIGWVLGQTGEGLQLRPLMGWAAVGLAVWVLRGDSPGRGWVRRWVFGRRVWLGFGLLFHGTLQLLLNLGGFPLATVGLYIACFSGAEVAGVVARLRGGRVVPGEDPSLPQIHRDLARLPGWVIGVVAAGLMMAAVVDGLGATPSAIRWTAIAAAGALIGCGWRAARGAAMDGSAVAWAYGPLGRLLAGTVCALHGAAILGSQIPERPIFNRARASAGGLVDRWLRVTGTAQRWAMFAPRPPGGNGSLHIEVVDADGETHDLQAELHRPEELMKFQWWPDRTRKVDLNVMTERKGLIEWYARGVCRAWALGHGGATPRTVTIVRRWAEIPLPWEPLPEGDRVARFVARARAETMRAVECAKELHGQLPPEVRARHGFNYDDTPFVRAARQDRWVKVRASHGPGWPYDEWLAMIAAVVVLGRWRREEKVRYLAAVARRRDGAR